MATSAVVAQVRVEPHAADMYGIFLGPRRLGYIRLYQPGGPPPVSWLPKAVGGVDMNVTDRIAILNRTIELMGEEWAKHEAQQRELLALENGLAAIEQGDEPPASEPAPVTPAE